MRQLVIKVLNTASIFRGEELTGSSETMGNRLSHYRAS